MAPLIETREYELTYGKWKKWGCQRYPAWYQNRVEDLPPLKLPNAILIPKPPVEVMTKHGWRLQKREIVFHIESAPKRVKI